MDNIKTDVNSSFKDKYPIPILWWQPPRVADNETKIIFIKKTSNDKDFHTPKTLEELNTRRLQVKLQEGLTINLEDAHTSRFLGRLVRKRLQRSR